MMIRIWHWPLIAAYRCARILLSIIRIPIHGSMVAIWNDRRILLVRNSYRNEWSIPGGMLKRGETWEAAAVRETLEEVGLKLNQKELVFIAEVAGDLGPLNRTHFFEVLVGGPIDIKIDGFEITRAEFVMPEEALNRPLNENVNDYLRTHPNQPQ